MLDGEHHHLEAQRHHLETARCGVSRTYICADKLTTSSRGGSGRQVDQYHVKRKFERTEGVDG